MRSFCSFSLAWLSDRYKGLSKTRQAGQEKIHDSYRPSTCKKQNLFGREIGREREEGGREWSETYNLSSLAGCTLTSLNTIVIIRIHAPSSLSPFCC